MDLKNLAALYSKSRIADRTVNELLGLCQGIISDGEINQNEAEFLYKWMIANQNNIESPVIAPLFNQLQEVLDDGVLDSDEAKQLLETLTQLTGADYEIGEVKKATTLPLNKPEPELFFDGAAFVFTGTFAFGSRTECESAVKQLGATCGKNVTKNTDFLVIGEYATDAWMQTSYGRKIEKAIQYQAQNCKVAIISEYYWHQSLPA